MRHARNLLLVVSALALFALSNEVQAQKSYDDHKMEDRFFVRIGGFDQTDIRTTLRLDAKAPGGGLAAGAVLGLESLFDVDDKVTTVRLDGWWRFSKKNRVNWSYWRSERDGMKVYNGDDLKVGDMIVINDGDSVAIKSDTTFIAVSYSYSFVNTAKFEAWLGGGLNFQAIDTSIRVNFGNVLTNEQEQAKGTIPIPTLNLGGRWNFSPKWRALLIQELFGLDIGDYSGRLNNTRLLVEYDIIRHFGFGLGLERYNFEVNAEGDEFIGEFDISYTGLSIYLKGQF